MENSKLCRLCALERDEFVKIYEGEGQKLNLATKITRCLQIWLYPEDPLPKTVCKDCCTQLDQYFNFFEKTSRAQLSLQIIFSPKTSKLEMKEEDKNNVLQSRANNTNSVTEDRTTALHVGSLDEDNNDGSADDDYGCDDDDDDDDAEPLDPNTSNSEIRNLLECVLGERDSIPESQKTYSSRRKCLVPVKRPKNGPTLRERKANVCKKRFERAAKLKAEKKVKADQEKEEVEEKIEKVLEEIAMGQDICVDFEAVENNFHNGIEYKTPLTKEVKRKKKFLCGRPGRKKKDVKPVLPKPRPKAVLEGYPWQCTECSLVTATLQELRSHHQTVHNQPPNFKCIQCGKVYTRYRSFARHVKLHRNPKKFKCEVCGKCFSQKTVLQSHSTVHTDARPHVCPQCGKAFKQFSSLYLHSKCHLPEQAKPKFPCDVCQKDFATKHTLETHRKIHTGERNFICDICGKSFIAKGSLDYHILTHSGDKPHSCPICGKGFKTARLLGKHATLHTGIKPHQCDVCGKQFRERGALREHNRIHTGAMPYTCEFCGKNFRFKGILTVHRRQHTGERPYSCTDCRREFTNWANYNKHMKRRHRNDGNPGVLNSNRNTNKTYQAPAGMVSLSDSPNKMVLTTTSETAIYNLSNHVTVDNSNSNLTSQGTLYVQHSGNLNSPVVKMAAANIYGTHLNQGSNKMTMYHHVNAAKMSSVMFHAQQDSSQDSSNHSVNNSLMGTYHVPSYVPTGLSMGSMGYYIPPIHHTDPSIEMLQHRMNSNP